MSKMLREFINLINVDQFDSSIPTIDELRSLLNLKESISKDKQIVYNYIMVIYFKSLNSKYKIKNNEIIITLDDLIVKLCLNQKQNKFKGDCDILTNTIRIFLDKLSDINKPEFENVFYHEATHYLNSKKYRDISKYKNTTVMSLDDYYKSEEEFEPTVIYILKAFDRSFELSSINGSIPKRELPKYIVKYMIPYMMQKSKMINNFIKNLDDKHLKKFYKMSVDYFAEKLSKDDIFNLHNDFFKIGDNK